MIMGAQTTLRKINSRRSSAVADLRFGGVPQNPPVLSALWKKVSVLLWKCLPKAHSIFNMSRSWSRKRSLFLHGHLGLSHSQRITKGGLDLPLRAVLPQARRVLRVSTLASCLWPHTGRCAAAARLNAQAAALLRPQGLGSGAAQLARAQCGAALLLGQRRKTTACAEATSAPTLAPTAMPMPPRRPARPLATSSGATAERLRMPRSA